jgi:transcriptional regulator with XRE-family HTH domain
MENKKIGLLLQGLRKQGNMTQLDLATKLNVSHQSVSKWENGDSLPDVGTLHTLAKLYGITMEELLQGEISSAEKQPHVTERDPKNQREKTRSIIRLALSIILFLTLFASYITVTVTNQFNSVFDPFGTNDLPITYYFKGFDLVFKAMKINFLTGGAWLLFLGTLSLVTIFSLATYSVFIKENLFAVIKQNVYMTLKLILEILVLVGILFIILQVLFTNGVSISVGLVFALIVVIGLFAINVLEKKEIL